MTSPGPRGIVVSFGDARDSRLKTACVAALRAGKLKAYIIPGAAAVRTLGLMNTLVFKSLKAAPWGESPRDGYELVVYDRQAEKTDALHISLDGYQTCCEDHGEALLLNDREDRMTIDRANALFANCVITRVTYDRCGIIPGFLREETHGSNQWTDLTVYIGRDRLTLMIYNGHNGYYPHDFRVRYKKDNGEWVEDQGEM